MKKISTFLDFELKTTKPEVLEEFGISKRKAKRIRAVPYVVCPMCGTHEPLRKTGTYSRKIRKRMSRREAEKHEKDWKAGRLVKSRAKIYNPHKEVAFNVMNVEEEPFVSIRVSTGRGKGFVEKAIITFKDIQNLPEEDKEILLPLVEQIRYQCERILKVTEGLIL